MQVPEDRVQEGFVGSDERSDEPSEEHLGPRSSGAEEEDEQGEVHLFVEGDRPAKVGADPGLDEPVHRLWPSWEVSLPCRTALDSTESARR